MSGRMGTGRGWRWESALQWGSSLRHRREGVRESGAATPARCLPRRLPRRIAHPPRLLPGHFTAREARAQTGFGVADQKTKGRTPGPCARKRVGTDGQTAPAPASPARRALGPGSTFPGTFQRQPLPLGGLRWRRGVSWAPRCSAGAGGSATAGPHQGLPGRPRAEGAPRTGFPVALTAVSLGGGSPDPAVHTRKQRPREVNAALKVTPQTGGRAGV